MGLKEKIHNKRVYFDTNIFIYIFEDYPDYEKPISIILNCIDSKNISTFTSEITLGEILVHPLKNGDTETAEKYINILNDRFFVTLSPTTQKTHIDAAKVRAFSGEKYPDAVHIATALHNDCEIFITNDKKIKPRKDIEIIYLDNV